MTLTVDDFLKAAKRGDEVVLHTNKQGKETLASASFAGKMLTALASRDKAMKSNRHLYLAFHNALENAYGRAAAVMSIDAKDRELPLTGRRIKAVVEKAKAYLSPGGGLSDELRSPDRIERVCSRYEIKPLSQPQMELARTLVDCELRMRDPRKTTDSDGDEIIEMAARAAAAFDDHLSTGMVTTVFKGVDSMTGVDSMAERLGNLARSDEPPYFLSLHLTAKAGALPETLRATVLSVARNQGLSAD